MKRSSSHSSEPIKVERQVAEERVSAEELAEFRRQLQADVELSSDLEDVRDGLFPSHIGRFEIQDELGRGSYGTVYIAYDPKMFRNVAVKVAHVDTHWSDFKRDRFFAEAHAAARLGHPNVVTVHEYGEEAGLLYIVYQLCIGPTLDQWMSERPDRTEPRVAVEIVAQLARGLSHAHARGIVHRDVKPSNVVLQETDDASRLPKDCPISFEPRLTDFGLAHDVLSYSERVSNSGLLGTIDYMSPEQVQGTETAALPTTDIYSLGVLLYRLLTGVLPSPGNNSLEVLQQICSTEPMPPRLIHPGVPRDLAAVCMHCLAKEPRQRYRDCETLIEDLENWKNGSAVSVRPRSTLESTARRVRAMPVVSALTVAIVAVCVLSGVALSVMVTKLRQTNAEQANLLAVSELQSQITESANRQLVNREVELRREARLRAEAAYRSGMRTAFQEFNAGRVLVASDTLDEIEAELRPGQKTGFDFKLLRARLAGGTHRLIPHSSASHDLVAIPGSSLVASCGDDGRILFQDVTQRRLVHSHYAGEKWHAHAIAIDAEAKQMAVGWTFSLPIGPGLSTIKVYRLDTSNEDWLAETTHQFSATTTVQSLCFSPDGKRLAIGPRYRPVSLHDLHSGEQTSIQTESRNRSVEFSPDGRQLLVTQKDDRVLVVDAQTGRETGSIAINGPRSAHWSADGRSIAVSCNDHPDVFIYSLDELDRMIGRATQSAGAIESLRFDRLGRRLIASTRTGSLAVWDLQQLGGRREIEPIQQVTPHRGLVTSLQFVATPGPVDCPDYVASVDDLGNVIATALNEIFEVPSSKHGSAERLVTTPHRSQTSNHSGPATFLAGYSDGSMRQVDPNGDSLKTMLEAYSAEASVITTSKDGRHAAMGWDDGRIAIITLTAAGEVSVCDCLYPPPEDSLHMRRISSLQFSDDAAYLAACGDDDHLRVWDVDHCDRPVWEDRKTSFAYCVQFVSPTHVACGGMFEEIAIHDVRSGKLCALLPSTSRTRAMQLDPDRGLLLSAHDDGRIRLHDIHTWQLQETLGESIEAITCLALSPDGACYLAGDCEGRLTLWDAATQKLIGSLCCFKNKRRVDTIEYCPTSTLVLSRSAGGSAIESITALAK